MAPLIEYYRRERRHAQCRKTILNDTLRLSAHVTLNSRRPAGAPWADAPCRPSRRWLTAATRKTAPRSLHAGPGNRSLFRPDERGWRLRDADACHAPGFRISDLNDVGARLAIAPLSPARSRRTPSWPPSRVTARRSSRPRPPSLPDRVAAPPPAGGCPRHRFPRSPRRRP